MARTVLIIEDDPDTRRLVGLYLSRDGHKVLTASNGLEGLALARKAKPDLIVLDLMLPGMNGMDICRNLREDSTVPILMLTARAEEKDRLDGLDLGADDYVLKPFSPRELAARVRAVMRRTAREAPETGPEEISYGDVTVSLKQYAARVGGAAVSLTPTEFRILALFMREPGRTFTREQIIDGALGYDFDGFDRTVDAHVANLRRKLNLEPGAREYIHTAYGVGYRFGDA